MAAPLSPEAQTIERFVELLGTPDDPNYSSTLTWSYEKPDLFEKGLIGYIASRSTQLLKSRAGVSYDIYHDTVLVHRDRGTAWYDPDKGGFTFRKLDEEVGAVAAEWLRAGVVAGSTIAVAYPFGLRFVVAILAGIRLGAQVTPLAYRSDQFVKRRLIEGSPEFVAGEVSDLERLDTGFACIPIVPSAGSDGAHVGSHSYGANDCVLRCFSALSEAPFDLVELKASELFLGQQRDRTIVFGFRPGERVAAPGFEPFQYEPQLVLATLAGGATYAHLPLQALGDAKELESIDVLGVHPQGIPFLEELPNLPSRLRLWFRSVTEKLNLEQWAQLETRFRESRIASLCLATNAAFGGTYTFSPRTLDTSVLRASPVPGEKWTLADPNGSGQESLSGSGVLQCERDTSGAALGEFFLGHHQGKFYVSGALHYSRSGRRILTTEIEELSGALEGVERSTLVIAPGDEPNHSASVLILFCNPLLAVEEGVGDKIAGQALNLIDRELGDEQRPDRVQIVFGLPSGDEEIGDREWTADQYFSGAFAWKSQIPAFLKLGQLRHILGLMSSD